MAKNTPLGDRMKRYENQTRYTLPKRSYTLMRLDGRAFHTYTKDLEKPFDHGLIRDMQSTALFLCKNISGAEFAYTQSDEISILLTDFTNHDTEPWFGGTLQKMVSVSAAMASVEFNRLRVHGGVKNSEAVFDSRVWTISDPNEVMNYFIWRQRDCVKNSITMAAQSVCSHKELHGLNSNERQELMFQRGINWNDYPDSAKRGSVVCKNEDGRHLEDVSRHFSADPEGWLAQSIPDMPRIGSEEE